MTVGQNTRIEGDNIIQGGVKIGNKVLMRGDSVVGAGTVIEDGATIGKQTRIGKRVTIGAGSTVGPGSRIGDGATVPKGKLLPRKRESTRSSRNLRAAFRGPAGAAGGAVREREPDVWELRKYQYHAVAAMAAGGSVCASGLSV